MYKYRRNLRTIEHHHTTTKQSKQHLHFPTSTSPYNTHSTNQQTSNQPTINMKASIIASTLALAGSAFAFPGAAAPAPLATIQLANDFSGANAIRSVPANGVANTFANVFAGTVLVKDGVVKATSVQNVAPQGPFINCVIANAAGDIVGEINNQKTFLDIDGDANKVVETDVSAFTIKCNQ